MDLQLLIEPDPELQRNLVSNLLDREIGTHQRKYGSIKDTYRNHCQLVAAIRPNINVKFDLDKCETPDPAQPNFKSLAYCLGFSPDGKYLAFHSHARSAITVLKYSGLEGGKIPDRVTLPSDFFGKKSKLELNYLVRDYNYNCGRSIQSWWTDDSSTIIVQLEMDGSSDDEDPNEEEEQESMELADDLVGDQRAHSINDHPDMFHDQLREFARLQRQDAVLRGGSEEGQEREDGEEDQDDVTDEAPPNRRRSNSDSMNIERLIAESLAYYSAPARNGADGLSTKPSEDQHRETSRTVPFWVATESAAELANDSERMSGETSRTMTVYHALTSSTINGEHDSYSDSEDEDPSQPSTSTRNPRRRPPQMSFSEPQRKKDRHDETEEREQGSGFLHDHVPQIIGRKEKARFGNWRTEDDRPVFNGRRYGGSMRSIQEMLRLDPRMRKAIDRNGINRSGLGYSLPDSELRSGAIRSQPTRHQRPTPKQHFRETITEQKTIHPIVIHADESNHYMARVVQNRKPKKMMAFIAYNVEKEVLSPLHFQKVYRKFNCHMRDRKLTVTYNNDQIEVHHLVDREKPRWELNYSYKLSKKLPIRAPLFYYVDDDLEMREVSQPEEGLVIGDFFDAKCFHSPIQQDTLTLLHRDMPQWFNQTENFRKEFPTVTQCHMIADDLLAITLTTENKAPTKPINLGLILSLSNSETTLYPDYHQFLKLIFTHHLADILPRQWSYLNPAPVMNKEWFKQSIFDISDSEEFENFERLKEIYSFCCTHMSNVKSTSNPISLLKPTSGFLFMSKFLYFFGNNYSMPKHSVAHMSHLEKFFHPVDPFVLTCSMGKWSIALRDRDPDDVIASQDDFSGENSTHLEDIY